MTLAHEFNRMFGRLGDLDRVREHLTIMVKDCKYFPSFHRRADNIMEQQVMILPY